MSYDHIPLTEVVSSNLHSVGYDAATQRLAIVFQPNKKTGDRDQFHYPNVDEELYERLMNAPSIGSCFHHVIRPRSGEDAGRRVSTFHADGTETIHAPNEGPTE